MAVEIINGHYRITTETPIWWVVCDEKIWYNKGYLEKGISDVGYSEGLFCFGSEEERDLWVKDKSKYVEEV